MQILIAHADRDFCEVLRDHLHVRRMDTTIRIVHRGRELLRTVQKEQPELVVASTVLEDIDGLKTMEILRAMPEIRQPELIVLSAYDSWALQQEICAARPLLYLSLPCDAAGLAERILNCCREIACEGTCSFDGSSGDLRHLLREFGLTSRSKGFSYIQTANRMMCELGTCSESLTKVIYPAVAKYHHTSAVNVERAIRSAIVAAWNREGYPRRQELFHGRPTNSEFLNVLYDYLKKQKNEDSENA